MNDRLKCTTTNTDSALGMGDSLKSGFGGHGHELFNVEIAQLTR